jgi:secreted trypsin-like serine protease
MVALVAISLNRVFCGAVIISEKWALTGAHCFNEEIYADLNNVVAYVGEHDLRTLNETLYTESHEIEKIIQHEGYDMNDYLENNDIALIKMKNSIKFSRAVGPACLPWQFEEE